MDAPAAALLARLREETIAETINDQRPATDDGEICATPVGRRRDSISVELRSTTRERSWGWVVLMLMVALTLCHRIDRSMRSTTVGGTHRYGGRTNNVFR